jgi:ribosomal protein L21E
MRYEEIAIFEKGDKVEILFGKYEGKIGVVIEDQIDADFYVDILLDDGTKIQEDADYLDLI